MAKKIIFSAFLILVVLATSIYLVMPDKVKIDIQNTRTQYSVLENDSWVLAATEYVNLFDGTTKMRASSREISYFNDTNYVYVIRNSEWKDGIVTKQTYTFDKYADKVEDLPISNTFECFNCNGKIVSYEIRDILYEGETKDIQSPFSFGHNMKLEWEPGNYYAKVFQQKSSDKIIVKYKPTKDYESYDVRLFDPPSLLNELRFYYPSNQSSGNLIDTFNGTLNFTDIGGVEFTSGKIGNGSVHNSTTYYNASGLDDYLWTRNFTLNLWLNITRNYTSSGALSRLIILSNANTYISNAGVDFGIDANAGVDNFVFRFDSGPDNQEVSCNQATSEKWGGNKWTMLTVTRAGLNVTYYVDGEFCSSTILNHNYVMVSGTWDDFYYGKQNQGAGAYYYDGILDEFGVWSRPISPTEVLELYNNGTGEAYPFGEDYYFNVTLISPEDNFTSNESQDFYFTCDANSSIGALNVSLVWNGAILTPLAQYNTSANQNIHYSYNLPVANGTANWSCYACNEIECIFGENWSFYLDVPPTPPVITLLGDNPVNQNVGDPYTDAGATAVDSEGGDLTSNIVVVNPVNISLPGTYYVSYNVNDSEGTPAVEVLRTVNINDVTNPDVVIVYPINTTYLFDVYSLTYNYSDDFPGSCWYSLDNGDTNSTSVEAGINFTNIYTTAEDNTWIVYCNDSSGNLNQSRVTFHAPYKEYLNFNIALNENITFEFRPENYTQLAVQPINQTSTLGCFVAQNNYSSDMDIYAILNGSRTGITFKIGNTSNYSLSTTIEGFPDTKIYSNLSVGSTIYLWSWADYDKASGKWFPELDIRGVLI